MILVTGGTGMVGHYLLTELIKNDKKVKAIFRTEAKRSQALEWIALQLGDGHTQKLEHIVWEKADILDIPKLTQAFEGITEVYHCAGLVSFDVRYKDKLRKINIEGTANMVNIALKKGVRKFCYLSSVAALGSELKGKPTRESSPRNNSNTHGYYDISKYGGEMEVWRASQEGLAVVLVNPGIIIGAGNWTSGSSQLFDRVAKGFPFRIPKMTGFVPVEDVVSAMIKLMKSEIVNERFVLVAENLRMREVTDMIAHNLHCKPAKYRLRKWMVTALWLIQSAGNFLFKTGKEVTRQDIKDIFKDVTFDNAKIQEELQFKFTPLEKSIEKTAQIYLKKQGSY